MVQRTAYGQDVSIVEGSSRCSICGDRCDKGIQIENRKGLFCSWECEGRANG